jgi:hypothetical protein
MYEKNLTGEKIFATTGGGSKKKILLSVRYLFADFS